VVCAVVAVGTVIAGHTHPVVFDRARAALSDWSAPAMSGLRTPLTAVQNWAAGMGSVFTIYSENAELRRENTELQKWQQVALSLEDRLRRYQQLLNAVPDEKTPFITARVIGESSRPFVRTLILNAGAANQVRKGQAVVDERGLLGRVYVTGEKTSWVILLTDLNSRVPVVIEPSHRRAILVGDNTPAPQLELDVGEGAIRPGDRVLSTGDGGLLPPDLPIGVVTGKGENARAVLFAMPANADAVNILDYRVPDPPAPTDPAAAVPLKASSGAAAPSVAAIPPDSRESPEELDQ
jgi:rod shape-determining protein MreC